MKNFLLSDNEKNLIDETFFDFFRPFSKSGQMRTDIRETDKNYKLEIEMPGFEKNEIDIAFSDGYLQVKATKQQKDENKNDYIKRERSLTFSRSYYLGEIVEDNIKAKYDKGILNLIIPKQEPKQQGIKRITIE